MAVAAEGDPPPMPAEISVVLSRDVLVDQGPLAGLASALAHVENPFVVVMGGDMPRVPSDVLELMISMIAADEEIEMVALEDSGVVRPLPCVLAGRATATVTSLVGSGERRLRALLDVLKVRSLPEVSWRALDPDGGSTLDVDLPEDMTDLSN